MNEIGPAQSFGIGQPVRRREDRRLVTGAGRYADDVSIPGMAHGFVLRSPYAHARLLGIDVERARKSKGVLAVLTAADLERESVKPIPTWSRQPTSTFANRDGSPLPDQPYYPLARGKVRFAGEAVAFVVAETRLLAQDAAEKTNVQYEPLDAVADAEHALAPGAPKLWEELAGNLCFDTEHGDAAATASAFAAAAHIVRLPHVNNRLIVHYMEPRAALADYDAAADLLTLRCGTQSVQRQRLVMSQVLGVALEKLRLVAGDVGGGFGARSFVYPEHVLTAVAAKRLGRPVKWRADRGENFLSDTQGRDQLVEVALALDAEGRFLGLRWESLHNIGAHMTTLGHWGAAINIMRLATGVYSIPAAHLRLRAAFANCAPTNAYRGVGRAEAIYALERVIDEAARRLGRDPVELRRRNFIPPAAMPCKTAVGSAYDSGEFAAVTGKAQAAADWSGFAARKAAAEARGQLYGRGLAYYIESAGGQPLEYAKLRAERDGGVTIFAGTHNHGQGHETSFVQVVAEKLGIPFEHIRLVYGDTAIVEKGAGTHGSRSMRMAGSAMLLAADALITNGTALASDLLEAAAEDIEYAAGGFRVRGTDRAISLADVAATAEGELAGDKEYRTEGLTFPNGCHVCEIEVDPETGVARIERYAAVDDVGRVVNPLLVHGQAHGGIAQGIGQALMERVAYDPDSAQLLSGSLMDYALPRASDVPFFAIDTYEVLCPTNPIGVKGAGEGGATGAPPAVMNALADALAGAGVTRIDMPASPEVIWRALRAARG
ncbi:MAG: xanthine dehydrogenase family protein molybdopterin-binding subunit [Rhodospirillaceae bacterium]|nr:xanthine dehydrogenase family protein molybdopterin-binding subunit [Rhodospirillaceae bacterium]